MRYPTDLNKNTDILEVAIIKAGQLVYQTGNLPSELLSDNSLVLLDIHRCLTPIMPPESHHFTDWNKFEEEMKVKNFTLPKLSTRGNIEAYIQTMTKFLIKEIQKISTEHVPNDTKYDLALTIRNHITKKRKLQSIL